MTANFLDIEQKNKIKNRGREVFLIFFILFFISISFIVSKHNVPSAQIESNNVAQTDISLSEINMTAGVNSGAGDISASPPGFVDIPKLEGALPDSASFGSNAFFAKDEATGVVLFAKNQYEQRPLASITKLMSGLVFLEKKLNMSSSTVVVRDEIVDTHMYAGDTYTLDELWNAGFVASSNKAILTLVDSSSWTRDAFVERMNQKALELGMSDSFFTEPTGLNSNNISTASDISILLSEALKHDEIRDSLMKKEYALFSKERKKEHHMWNTNWLLLNWIPNFYKIIGGKTGFIEASGYNFAVQFEKDGHKINVIVLGANTHEERFIEAQKIADAVFSAYKWP
jgi:D-alanyl-D-alanine endopeptidase (penicillin-binding protein 7)